MDGLSGAASIITVIDISAKVVSLCFHYSLAVKDAKRDIERLQNKVTDIKDILEEIRRLLDGQDKIQFSATRKLLDSLKECQRQLQGLHAQLEPHRGRKVMQRIGFRALKWPFTGKQVEKMVNSLEQYEQTFSLALQVDQTGLILSVDRKLSLVDKKTDMVLSKIHVAKLPTANGAAFDSRKEEHNSTCLPNTRTELLRHIQGWADDVDAKPIFWLNGAAGTGKSTIARTIARTFADQHQLGASFFFKRGEGECGDATKFFTTIATQLVVRVPEIGLAIKRTVDVDPDICEKALKVQFEKLILNPLSQAEHLPTLALIIVIDALDECERDGDIQAILQLFSRTRIHLKPGLLRIFVTSRPELHLRLGFRQMPDGTYEDLILHEVMKETIRHDIRAYFEYELGQVQQQRSLSSNWPRSDQIDALVEQAIPLFIFAATACRYIGDRRGNPKKRLDIVLEYGKVKASKLDATYLPILNQLFDEEDEEDRERWICEFREIVGSIVILEAPLSTASLAHLLQISKEDVSCTLDSLHSVLSIPSSDSEPIRLLHLSFREFLVDVSKQKCPFWVDETDRHERLASYCIKLMSGPDGLHKNMCGLRPGSFRSEIDEGMLTNRLSPELQYACRYWVGHLAQCHSHTIVGDSTDMFLRQHFLHWLEAMSLIGDLNKCIPMIETLYALANSSNTALSDFLQDAKRFILRFHYIIQEAPLQIYYSALVFAPEASIIRKGFKSDIPEWVHISSKRDDEWDACRSVLDGHSVNASSVAFSHDSAWLASSSDDGTVKIWDTSSSDCFRTLDGHGSGCGSATFSHDSAWLASAYGDGTAKIWEASSGECLLTLEGHSDVVRSVAFSHDSVWLASASKDKTIKIWDTRSGECLRTLEGHSQTVRSVTFSHDSAWLASASASISVSSSPASSSSSLALYQGVVYDGIIKVWDASSGECLHTLEGHSGAVWSVAFSHSSTWLASASKDKTIKIWDPNSGECLQTLEGHSVAVRSVCFSHDAAWLVSASDDKTIKVWTTTSGECIRTLAGHSYAVGSVAFSHDSAWLASASYDSTVKIWNTTNDKNLQMLESHNEFVSSVAFSHDAARMASASKDKTIKIWDVSSGECLRTLEGHNDAVRLVNFSNDVAWLASASDDKTTKVWDISTGECRWTLEGDGYAMFSVAFSHNSAWFASASTDGIIKIWDISSRRCLQTLEGHNLIVTSMAFSGNLTRLASTSWDYTTKIWDTNSGECLQTLQADSDIVTLVALSHDAAWLVSELSNRTVKVWDARSGECLQTIDTGIKISLVSFNNNNLYFQTEKGASGSVPLPGSDTPLTISQPGIPQYQGLSLSPDNLWISFNSENLIWLPSDYRPSSLAVSKNTIGIGGGSGRVWIGSFDVEKYLE